MPSTTFIERLVLGLSKKGHMIYLFGNKAGKLPTNSNLYFSTYSNRFGKLILYLKYSLLLSFFKRNEKKKLDRIIGKSHNSQKRLRVKYYPVLYHKPDIFHLQWAKGIEDWIWVKEFGIKLVLSLRGAHINYSPIANVDLANKYKRIFPLVDGFHAVSEAIKKEAVKYNADPKKIQVVYSGLNLGEFLYQDRKQRSKDEFRIVSVGRGHWKKGYSDAITAFKKLKDFDINFEYTIIGVTSDEELLYGIRENELDGHIHLNDHVFFNRVLQIIKDAEVLFLPSIEEGIANVVLEAMAVGTLVVSTDCGGMGEVLINEKNGYIIPIGDTSGMAEALLKVNNLSEDEYYNLTSTARETIEGKHNESKMINEMCNLYFQVLN